MDDDLLTLLHTSKIFSPLTKRTLRRISSNFERIELSPDEILYYQGDPSDSIELLLSGKLISILTTATGENKIVGDILPGETVGELGAISGEPRSTTIKAAKHSVLFKLPSEVFAELCHQYPPVLIAIINPIISRSQKMVEVVSSEKFKKHIAFIPANADTNPSLTALLEKFQEQIGNLTSLIIWSDYSKKFDEATPEKMNALLTDLKEKNVKKVRQRILYFLKSADTPLAKFCFEKIDMLYIVADAKSPICIDDFVLKKIDEFKSITNHKPELILLHDDDSQLPRNTLDWLQLTEFHLHHHIRLNLMNDIQRLIRFIRSKAVGLVLSGGGTRGWGHVGAIKALEEAGIPIDAVGGCSVGSIIAASYALTESWEGTLDHFRDILDHSRHTVSWFTLTYPAISLFNAKALTEILYSLFQNIQIEDLWLPYFCISTNLAKNSEAVHQSGMLWEKIRASISIPGVIPPMLLNNELHFDGGLLNSIPVDVMRNIVGQRGNVIAVELGGSVKDEHKYQFPPVLTFWQTMLAKWGWNPDYKFPPFIDTFLKSLNVGSSMRSQMNSLNANLLITLDLSRFPMLHSNKKVEDKIVDIGYQTAVEQIKNMQQKKL